MHVVSVMNYKGGVGKTTLTANIAAETANLGHRVLVIDLDPQANLTLSFYTTTEWQEELRENRTIKRWYDGDSPGQKVPLAELVVTPPRVNERIQDTGGRLDLIASHLGLIDIDLQWERSSTAATTSTRRPEKNIFLCMTAWPTHYRHRSSATTTSS